ncbi:gluconate 2-dehydrogenase subunit 3 family protein [Aquirufa sp. ROCK2-A2]
MKKIDRRDAIQRVAFLMGGVISAPAMAGIMGKKTNNGSFVTFTAEQESLIAEVADVIIPTTSTPGAKAAKVEQFIVRVVRDCYTKADQEIFYAGLSKLDSDCKTKFGTGFASASTTQKKDALTTSMLEADLARKKVKGQATFFFMIKELTTTGYFTSEIGATKALEYLSIPGKFDGCMPLTAGQKTWAI